MNRPIQRHPLISAKAARILLKVVRHIIAVPARYDQDVLIARDKPGANAYDDIGLAGRHEFPACGTIGCIAGWVKLLEATSRNGTGAIDFAMRTLALPNSARSALFGGHDSWPEKFRDAYGEATTLKQRAWVLERRVKHFIRTAE